MPSKRHFWIWLAIWPWLASGAAIGQDRGGDDNGATMKFRITRRPGQGGAPPGPGFAVDPGIAAWTLKVGDTGQVIVVHDGVEVIRSGSAFAAQPNARAAGKFSVTGRSAQQVDLRGAVEALGLEWQGRAFPTSPRELRIELDVVASKPLTGIVGGGLTWTLKSDASGLRGKAGRPELLADQTGWRWPVGDGQEVAVRFDRPIARLFFEPGKPEEIRTSFVGDRIRTGRGRIGLTVTLPEGGRIVANDAERYASPDRTWFREALHWDAAPVDLSFLNADDRPAGRHGPVRAEGDRLVYADGTPARFWGTNLTGPVLFSTPRENIPRQARRMAQLGYNLARIHQQESPWVNPNIYGKDARDTRHLDPRSLDMLDLWIKCLKDEGLYVWLDLHFLRELKPADGVTLGRDEIARQRNRLWGFNYLNPELMNLMKESQHQYLNHVNRYTGLAYKDDPALIGVLITNENDLTSHFGVAFLPDKNNPVHKGLFDRELAAFGKATGLPADRLWRTWEPGPSKYLLCDLEARFFRSMIDDLRAQGVKAPIAPTSMWGGAALYSLPALTLGDVIDAHMYGKSEALGTNPHDTANFLCEGATAQVHGKPVTLTEWNVPYPEIDRFTTPLYVASIASLQGWDAPMLYNYAQVGLEPSGVRHVDRWSTVYDPAITGVMPAAALAFRRGHVSPARRTYCLAFSPAQFFGNRLAPESTTALRTLVEQSRVTVGMPAVKELPWLKPTELSGDVIAVKDPGEDFLVGARDEVHSDTGELMRIWRLGVQAINTPRTKSVAGWIGGKTINLKDAAFQFQTRKAVVALSSVDDQPLASSRFVLITAVAQARPSPPPTRGPAADQRADNLPFLSEPVVGTIQLRNPTSGLELLSLGPDGRVLDRSAPERQNDALVIRLPAGRGTHWYVLRTRQLSPAKAP